MTRVVSGRRIPWVRGPSAVVDGYQIGATTSEHDVYFERVVPYASVTASNLNSFVTDIGATIDSMIDSGTAESAVFVQDAGPGSLLVNAIEFTVLLETTPDGGEVTDTVLVTIQQIHDQGAGGVQGILQNLTAKLRGTV